MKSPLVSKATAIMNRNAYWEGNPKIPSWVDVEDVDLDQFFTKADIAKRCHDHFMKTISADGARPSDYKFIEPSAGNGAFLDLLPAERRIGIDIMPQMPEVEAHDFLSWSIKPNGYRYAVIGNPPFGYRAWLALAFMNHAASFADYVGMILPMAFQSDGKGSPKHRVVGMELLHSEVLPSDSFTDAYGNGVKVNALWQIWKKGHNAPRAESKCDSWVDLFTVDQRKERLCGHMRMHEADHFLQRTFYREPPNLVKCFSQVRYVCGYGIVIKQKKREVEDFLRSVDWKTYSNLAAHNCRHISMYHIRNALTDGGFVDG
jgi:hypothetical protein